MSEDQRPLWAPWRIEFIRAKKGSECFLCGKEEGFDSAEEPLIVARLNSCFVILNRYPYNSGHLMVAPYRHVGDISDLSTEESHEIMDVSIRAKDALVKLMRPEGFNIGFNLGISAGAGLAEHIHLHIVPRWTGDTNFMPVIGDARVVPEALEKTAGLLRDAWCNL